MRGVALPISGWERRCGEFSGFSPRTIIALDRAHVYTLGTLLCLSETWVSSIGSSVVLDKVKEALLAIETETGNPFYTLRPNETSIHLRIARVFPQPGIAPVGILHFTHHLRPVTIAHLIGLKCPSLSAVAQAMQKGTLHGMLTKKQQEEIKKFLEQCKAWDSWII